MTFQDFITLLFFRWRDAVVTGHLGRLERECNVVATLDVDALGLALHVQQETREAMLVVGVWRCLPRLPLLPRRVITATPVTLVRNRLTWSEGRWVGDDILHFGEILAQCDLHRRLALLCVAGDEERTKRTSGVKRRYERR